MTTRLWMRAVRAEDADDLHVLFGDEACMTHWHHAASVTPEDTRDAVGRLVDNGDGGYWAFGVHDLAAVLGFVGYVNGLARGARAGFGYALRRSAWGQGLVVEAANAALAHGFDDVGIAAAELWIQRGNRRSWRVAEKLGCKLRSDGPTLVYGLTAEQWRGEDDPPPAHRSAEPILGVRDVAAAVRWWVDVVGFRAGFSYGDPPTHAAVLAAPGWTGGPRVQLTQRSDPVPSTVYVVVADLDAAAQRAVDAGAVVVTPLGLRPWGVRELELADPDGNVVRLG
jgi:RimJ/RimL family protein N-acetyltransferase/uncharacterized glyoxalase superfamily protein PhnB